MDEDLKQLIDTDPQKFIDILSKSSIITSLYLDSYGSDDPIDEDGATTIATALKNNSSVTSLNLNYNDIGNEGVEHIADALKTNSSITSLSLRDNYIDDDGAKHIGDMLKVNKSLREIDLETNNITDKGIWYIAAAPMKYPDGYFKDFI